MSDDQRSRLERALESTARKVSGGGLHPLELRQRVVEAVERTVADGMVGNDVRVGLSASDYERLAPGLDEIEADCLRALDEFEQAGNLRRIGERLIRFEAVETPDGTPAISVRFIDTSQTRLPVPRGATKRLAPQRGAMLLVSDGRRVPLTHTPFTIGRAPDNDLVVPSLAVSRRHAEVSAEGRAFVVRDAGSRNGLSVEGHRAGEVVLSAGVKVFLGDVWISLERGP
jgi:hypothetical protein